MGQEEAFDRSLSWKKMFSLFGSLSATLYGGLFCLYGETFFGLAPPPYNFFAGAHEYINGIAEHSLEIWGHAPKKLF